MRGTEQRPAQRPERRHARYRCGSLGGPIVTTGRSSSELRGRLKALGGGSRAIMPTDAMRTATSPLRRSCATRTPARFPGNRIPRPDRSAARKILDFFYRAEPSALAAKATKVPPDRRWNTRDRADGRVDHELTRADSVFASQLAASDPDAYVRARAATAERG
jgi:hypothetical protein